VHPLLYLSGSGAVGPAVMPLLSSTRQDLHMVSYADMITDSDSPAATFNMADQDVMVFLHIQKTGGDEASLLSRFAYMLSRKGAKFLFHLTLQINQFCMVATGNC
jgi:hypothetical protein